MPAVYYVNWSVVTRHGKIAFDKNFKLEKKVAMNSYIQTNQTLYAICQLNNSL